jgi:hypothetical protein
MHPPNPSAGTSSRHKDIGSEATAAPVEKRAYFFRK